MPGQALPLVFVSQVNFGIQQSAQCFRGGGAGFLDTFIFLLFCGGAFRLLCCIAFCSQKEAKMHWQLIFGLSFFLSIYLRVVSENAGNCIFAGSSCPI